MLASAGDWFVVAAGMTVVIATVVTACVVVARVLRNPRPPRPRPGGTQPPLAPPLDAEDDSLGYWDDQIDADGEWHP